MSDTILKLIPIDPGFVPNLESQVKANLFLRDTLKGHEIEVEQTEDVEFIDPGSNLESVSCNCCGKDIDMEVWQEAMNNSYESQFADLTFDTRCCRKTTTLNNLVYNHPAGFAKFAILISDPHADIQYDQFNELQKILGTGLKKIWAHY